MPIGHIDARLLMNPRKIENFQIKEKRTDSKTICPDIRPKILRSRQMISASFCIRNKIHPTDIHILNCNFTCNGFSFLFASVIYI